MKHRHITIPETIIIDGEVWRVTFEHNAPKKYRKKHRSMLAQSTLGVTHFSDRLIILADGLTEDQAEETFIHELLHAALKGNQELGYDLEERIVEHLDGPLQRIIRQLEIK